MTRLDVLMQTITVVVWLVSVVLLVASGFIVIPLVLAVFGGYCLFRAWWATWLARGFFALADGWEGLALTAIERDELFERWARLLVRSYGLRWRAWWVARWPLRGFRFRLPPIAPCPCGGPRIFVDGGVSRPAQFRYACLDCGFGARDGVDQQIAAGARRLAERGPEA